MNKEKLKGLAEALLIHLAGSIVLCVMAFYNSYPLVYSDTGTHIVSGFENFAPIDRPIVYGWFLRHTSLSESPWFTIIVQGLIVSFVILQTLKVFTGRKRPYRLHLFSIVTLVLTTGISVNTSQLIPDIFTPVIILCLLLLLFAEKLSRLSFIATLIILLLGLSSHTSHFFISGTILGIITLYAIIKRRKQGTVLFSRRSLVFLWAILIAGGMIVPLTNRIFLGKFTTSTTSHVFFMQKLHETGVLSAYLKEKCKEKDYTLCQYKEKMTFDFLWDTASPLYKTGGWENSATEYNRLISDILTTPKYLKLYTIKSAINTVKTFFSFEAGNTPVQSIGSPAFSTVERYFNDEVYEYLGSAQNSGKLNYDLLNFIQKIVVLSSLLVIVLVIAKRPARRIIPPLARFLALYILIALIANAAVCGALASLSQRFQARVVWLAPFCVIILAYIVWRHSGLKEKIRSLITPAEQEKVS